MVFYVWRDRLPLSLIGVVILAGLAWLTRGTIVYDFALALALSYATFWLAYIPGGVIRRFNELGDYSYGIYIYAFPLQGFSIWLLGNLGQATARGVALLLQTNPRVNRQSSA